MRGYLPNGWKSKNASEIFTLQGGYAFKSEDAVVKGTRWLKIANVGFGKVLWEEKSFLPPGYLNEHQNFCLHTGDLVVAMTRPLLSSKLKIAKVTDVDTPALLNQRVGRIIPTESILNDYLYHVLCTEKIAYQLESDLLGTDPPNLSIKTFHGIKLTIPPLPEQAAIAALLSTWELAIEKIELLIAAKEIRYLWLSKKYLFGDAADTANASKKTKWFSVPDHWKIVKIGKIANEVSVFNNSGENISVLSCTKYDGLVDSLTYFDKQVYSQDTSTYKVVTRGQFAYATNHIEEGSIGYQDVYDKGLVSPIYTAFETDKRVDDSYLYKVFKSVVYLHIFRSNTSSSVDRRGSLRWKEFAKLPIPLPPIEEQKQIAAILTTARQEIDLLKQQAEAYRRQKRGLMQRLLTGEWRVRVG